MTFHGNSPRCRGNNPYHGMCFVTQQHLLSSSRVHERIRPDGSAVVDFVIYLYIGSINPHSWIHIPFTKRTEVPRMRQALFEPTPCQVGQVVMYLQSSLMSWRLVGGAIRVTPTELFLVLGTYSIDPERHPTMHIIGSRGSPPKAGPSLVHLSILISSPGSHTKLISD